MNRILLIGLCTIAVLQSFAQAAAPKTFGYLSAGKLKIYYCDQGKGPAVVLLHPGFLDMHIWDRQADSLAKDHRVIQLDLPGHGQSAGVDTSIRIAEVIYRVMRVLNVPKASFAGISLGASCVIDFALAHPEKVSKLVLCSPAVNGWEDVMKSDTMGKRVYVRPDSYFNTNEPDLVVENFIHYWLDGPYRETAPVDAAVRAYVTNTASGKVKRKNVTGPLFDKRVAAKRVSQVRKPLLVLYGRLDIPFTRQVSEFLRNKIKNTQVRVVDSAAHLFVLEKPEVVKNHLKEWLQ